MESDMMQVLFSTHPRIPEKKKKKAVERDSERRCASSFLLSHYNRENGLIQGENKFT